MYCSNCGNKLDEKAVVCPKCGVEAPGGGLKKSSKGPENGKSVASLVLGILGVVFGLLYLISVADVDWTIARQMEASVAYQVGYAIGSILIPITFAIVGICLAVSARKIAKNGKNTAGFWLAITTFIISAIIFIIFLSM